MTRVRLIFALLSCCMIAAAAPAAQASPSEDGGGRHFLWRAVGAKGTPVYLLGSIHALPQKSYPLPEAIESAYRGAEIVAFEVGLDEIEKAAGRMMALAALPPESRLADVLDEGTLAELEAYLAEAGLSLGSFTAMRPWMVALSLTSLELMKAGYSPEAGIDYHFAVRAVNDGKVSLAFEDAEFQISLFADMASEEEAAFLRYTLRDLRGVVPQIEELTLAWRTGDVAAIAGLLTEAFEDEDDLYARLVVDRNEAWLTRVVELLEGDRRALVVVGALHLVGDSGLVARLKESGYDVEQH